MKTKRRQNFESVVTSSGSGGLTGSGSLSVVTPSSSSAAGGLLSLAPAGNTATLLTSGSNSALPPSMASSEVQRSMRELSKQLHLAKDRMDSVVHTLENIERAKQRLSSNDSQGRSGSPVASTSSGYARSRLRSLLSTAIGEAKNEATTLHAAIAICNQIVKESSAVSSGSGIVGGLATPSASTTSAASTTPGIGSLALNIGSGQPPLRRGVLMALLMRQADTLPIWVPPISDPDDEPPPLCGSTPIETYYTAKTGDMVAAKVRSDDQDDSDENWILSEVLTFNQATSKYEVVDIDAEEGKQIHVLSRRRVIPLPLWRANPRTHPDALFQPGTVVLALYPQTTCFYKGIVDRPPRKCREPYQILFEDTCYPDGLSPPLPVAQRYVICFREDKSKSSGLKL